MLKPAEKHTHENRGQTQRENTKNTSLGVVGVGANTEHGDHLVGRVAAGASHATRNGGEAPPDWLRRRALYLQNKADERKVRSRAESQNPRTCIAHGRLGAPHGATKPTHRHPPYWTLGGRRPMPNLGYLQMRIGPHTHRAFRAETACPCRCRRLGKHLWDWRALATNRPQWERFAQHLARVGVRSPRHRGRL